MRRVGKVKLFGQYSKELVRLGTRFLSFSKGVDLDFKLPEFRKIRYFYDFMVRNINGAPKLLYKRSVNDPLSKEQGPLKNSKYCTYIGTTPHYPGMARGLLINGSNRVLKVMLDNLDYIKREYSNFYDIFVKELINYRWVIGGGVNTNLPLLKIMADDVGLKLGVDEILSNLIDSHSLRTHFSLPKVGHISGEDIADLTKLNLDASPGLMTKLLFGRNRRSSIGYSVRAARRLLNFCFKFPIKNWSLWEMLAREKDVKSDEGLNVPTRLVVSMEEPHMLINAIFGQKLTKPLAKDITNSIFTGRSLNTRTSVHLTKCRRERDVTFTADWTNFDLYVTPAVFRVGFALLRGALPLDSKYDRFLYYCLKSMEEKYICVNPGYVYKIVKGLPSGHPLGSIMGSIINLIYWELIMYRVYGRGSAERFDIFVSGDDTVINCDYHPNLDNLDQIIMDLGLKSDVICGNMCFPEYISDFRRTPSFLQKYYTDGICSFNPKRLIRRLVFPVHKRLCVTEDIDLLVDYADSNPHDVTLCNFIYDIVRWITIRFVKVIPNMRLYSQRRLHFAMKESVYDGFSLMIRDVWIRTTVITRGPPSGVTNSVNYEVKDALQYYIQYPLNFIDFYKKAIRSKLSFKEKQVGFIDYDGIGL